ncbi:MULTISPECIES: hypothetical protein [Methanococcoides]|uniref:Uncharacterized protein n=1 Tax=Methanococcoides seepicolus TaxID=2828780 RepID=A0A9E5DCM7_9EURY|nr:MULTISPECIES: hypothetical protein [Methanococcoides]MCM1987867.1 hypothetical protein [Methanococcoides seepicolus]
MYRTPITAQTIIAVIAPNAKNSGNIANTKKLNIKKMAATNKNHFGSKEVSTTLSSIPGRMGLNLFEMQSPQNFIL